jgi:hypothetical protein
VVVQIMSIIVKFTSIDSYKGEWLIQRLSSHWIVVTIVSN